MEVEQKIMDRIEIVNQAISHINVDYVEEAIQMPVWYWRPIIFANHTRRYLILAVATVVLLLIAGGTYNIVRLKNIGKSSAKILSFTEFIDQVKEGETEMTVTYVQVGDHAARYELIYMSQTGLCKGNEPAEYASVYAVNEETLQAFIGDLYSEVPMLINEVTTGAFSADEYQLAQNCSWYKVKGASNLRYLIRKGLDGSLSIWEYTAFQTKDCEELNVMFPTCRFETYTYGEVLEAIYNVDTADDIVGIRIDPSDSDNTPEGKNLREVAEPIVIKDRKSILSIYKLLREMDCYGSNSIDLQQYEVRSPVIGVDLNPDHHVKAAYLRNLLIMLSDESKIDSLKYSAIWGAFYENNGIAYEILSDEKMSMVNELFGVRTE